MILTKVARFASAGEAIESINAMHHRRTHDLHTVIYILLAVDPDEPRLACTCIIPEKVVARRVVLTRVGAALIQTLKQKLPFVM